MVILITAIFYCLYAYIHIIRMLQIFMYFNIIQMNNSSFWKTIIIIIFLCV